MSKTVKRVLIIVLAVLLIGGITTGIVVGVTNGKKNDTPTHTHDWGDVTYTWNADHTVYTATRVCKTDGSHKETANSTKVEKGAVTEATCQAKKTTAYTVTFAADSFVTEKTMNLTVTEGDLAAHAYNDGKVTTNPTCTVKGIKTYTCTVCGQTKTEDVPATGHTEVVDAAVAATCTEKGKTEGKHCSVCNTVIVAQTEIAAKGHTWGEVSYTWADDYSACTAKRLCNNDSSHVDEITTSNISQKTTTPANCQTEEVVTYTATFSGNWSVSKVPYEGSDATKPVTGLINDSVHVYGEGWTGEEVGHRHATTCGHTPTAAVAKADATNSGYREHTEEEKTTGCATCKYNPFNGIFTFTENDDGYTLSKYLGSATEVTIPSVYMGKPVTAIGDEALKKKTTMTSVTIPDSITYIGAMAFSGCEKLKSVTIPDSVTYISYQAFSGCDSLTIVKIPNGIKTTDRFAFAYCDSLKSVIIPKSLTKISDSMFWNYGCHLESVFYEGDSAAWNKVEGRDNKDSISGTVYYYSEEKPSDSGNYWHYDTDGKTPVIW